jgi:hypothetical protein
MSSPAHSREFPLMAIPSHPSQLPATSATGRIPAVIVVDVRLPAVLAAPPLAADPAAKWPVRQYLTQRRIPARSRGVRHLADGGGRGATSAVRRDPAPDRPAARAARAGDVTGDNETMATAEGRTMRRSAVGPAATRCRGASKRFPCLPTLRIAASGAHPVDRHLSREHRRCRDGSGGNLG